MESLTAPIIVVIQAAILGSVGLVWRRLGSVERKMHGHLEYHRGKAEGREEAAREEART
ncbi:MAG: hypothetical protein WD533_06500 [Dehalococcoidia bacterium]